MKKVIGYLLAIVGFVIIVSGLGFIKIQFLGDLPGRYSTIAGIVFIIFSIIFLKNEKDPKSSQKGRAKSLPKDLPIYEGGEVIGYRRHRDTRNTSTNAVKKKRVSKGRK